MDYEITVAELKRLRDRGGEFTLLDVRELLDDLEEDEGADRSTA